MIRLFTLDVNFLSDDSLYREYYGRLSLFRKEKADRFRFQKDRNLCVGAGILISAGLSAFGIPLSEGEMAYGTGENGKPFFLNLPELHFNLSHSGTAAAAVFSDAPCGCDIEMLGKAEPGLSRRFFTGKEHAFVLSGSSPEEQRDRFFRLWTLKESFMKCTGLGFRLPLSDFEMDLSGDTVSVSQSVDDNSYDFREFSSVPGCRLAVCSVSRLPADLFAENVRCPGAPSLPDNKLHKIK